MGKQMIIDPKNQPFQEIHKLMIGSIVPRPIAFVSTISNDNKFNLAPFSYFNGVCSKPPTVVFCPARRGWDGKETTEKEIVSSLTLKTKSDEKIKVKSISAIGIA